MPDHPKWHGYFAALVLLAGWPSDGVGNQPIAVESRRLDIAFTTPETAQPLAAVELWYRAGGQAKWQQYRINGERESPVTFEAPDDGRYDLFLVLRNATGPSSEPPSETTTPHLSILVDATPPVVQLHDARQSMSLGLRVLQIRWTAVDTNLPARPVEIMYQASSEATWRSVGEEPVANTGRYDWRVPDDLIGSVAVRVAVTDLAGHRVASEPVSIDLLPQMDPVDAAGSTTAARSAKLAADAGASAVSGSRRARELAKQLLDEALQHRDRGRFRDGIARLREAVRLDPKLTEGFAELGSMLYSLGDLDRALAAYNIALEQDGNLRSALAGAAKIHANRKEYNKAAHLLRTILRYDPSDAEMWMALGDVAVYQGDEMLARESYMRASQVEPSAVDVVEEARKRLALMSQVSRTYHAGDN